MFINTGFSYLRANVYLNSRFILIKIFRDCIRLKKIHWKAVLCNINIFWCTCVWIYTPLSQTHTQVIWKVCWKLSVFIIHIYYWMCIKQVLDEKLVICRQVYVFSKNVLNVCVEFLEISLMSIPLQHFCVITSLQSVISVQTIIVWKVMKVRMKINWAQIIWFFNLI